MRMILVPVGSSPLNDSIPDAKTGQAVLADAVRMLQGGHTYKETLAALSVKWGATETIQAIAMAVGQANFKRAVEDGYLYRLN